MSNKSVISVSSSFFKPLIFWVVLVLILSEYVTADWEEEEEQQQTSLWGLGPLVKKNERVRIISTENGDVSEARVTDGNETFQLHFITLEPNSLFLPVLLHYDMVFYVQTGTGKLSYMDEEEKEDRTLRRGDVHRLRSGAVFFIQSDLENERQKLRIVAIFDNSEFNFNEPALGPYSNISDLVLGFDDRVLSTVFKAPEPAIEEIRSGTRPAAIIHGLQNKNNTIWPEMEHEFREAMYNILELSNKHKHKQKKSKLFNIFGEEPDFENSHGWSTTANNKKHSPLKGSKYGIFMVYLNMGSMMGPHWNPVATEIAVVEEGKGMVQVACSGMVNPSECKNSRYFVEVGDVFVIPRFHAMAQMAFDNETFVFMGFSTSVKKNHPQYLAGRASVLRTLDKLIVAASFGANVSTVDKILSQQDDSIILACTSCAEEEWLRMMEEIEKERQEEREKEEEETRRKEEERQREEEAAREREEAEAKKKEEEAQRKREEEEAQKKKEEEEAWKKWQEEEARKKREEEEAQKKKEEEEVWKKWQEEEERKRQEQEERERQQREQEEKERQEQQQREQEEKERQEQQQREQEEKERQEQRQREQEKEAKEREQERAREAEKEREAKAKREEEAAKEAEGGQWGEEGQGEQVPGEQGGQGQWGEQAPQEEAARQEEAAQGWEEAQGIEGRGQQESARAQEEQASAQGWARRILKKIA